MPLYVHLSGLPHEAVTGLYALNPDTAPNPYALFLGWTPSRHPRLTSRGELVQYVAWLLIADCRAWGTRADTRALTCALRRLETRHRARFERFLKQTRHPRPKPRGQLLPAAYKPGSN